MGKAPNTMDEVTVEITPLSDIHVWSRKLKWNSIEDLTLEIAKNTSKNLCLIVSGDCWTKLLSDPALAEVFDPSSSFDLIGAGFLGQFTTEVVVITDSMFHPETRIVEHNKWCVAHARTACEMFSSLYHHSIVAEQAIATNRLLVDILPLTAEAGVFLDNCRPHRVTCTQPD